MDKADKPGVEVEADDERLAKWLEQRRNEGLFDCVDDDLTQPNRLCPFAQFPDR